MELVPFCTYTAAVMRPYVIGNVGPGSRVYAPVESAALEGEHVSAVQIGGGADWLLTDGTGVAAPDVRILFRATDDALISMSYGGLADWKDGPGSAPVYISVRFEASDEKYAWLNRSLFVGKGVLKDRAVNYRIARLA